MASSKPKGVGLDMDDAPLLFRPSEEECALVRRMAQRVVTDPEERALVLVMTGVATRNEINPAFTGLLDTYGG